MATITGFIEKIKFRNEENGYTIMTVTDQSDGDEVVMVGVLSYAAEGDMIQASGHMTEHPVYGEQLQIESYELKNPEDAASMERYLGSGAIKGIGAAMAARIVRRFKADTFRIMEEEPERLSEIKGISEKMAMAIAEQVQDKKEMRYDVSSKLWYHPEPGCQDLSGIRPKALRHYQGKSLPSGRRYSWRRL